jgi:zinc protease
MMFMTRIGLLVCAALVAIIPVSRADDPAATKLAATATAAFKNIRTETLPNGLRVYLLPIPGAPVVTTKVAYKVGAADEDKDQTGLSHYLEHLLFKGTDKLMPGDIDRITQRNGGRNNAYTSEDMTVYHFDFAADRWQVALEIEADRMRNVRIDEAHEFEQEKGAVIAELKGGEDQPWGLEYKKILPLLFPPSSPYAHPVIGQEEHVRGATAEIITRYYDQWYHPNNAALVVVGGFDPDAAMAKITELFGPIPKGELPPRKPFPPIPPRDGPVRKEFESKFDVPRLLMGFNGVAVHDSDLHVLDVIEQILARGKTSRLYRTLVEGERVAGSVGATNNAGMHAGRYPSWFEVNVELLHGQDRKQVEELVFAELRKLAAEPVTDAELNRVRRSMLASFVFSQESVHGLADMIARSVTLRDLDHLTTYLDRVLAVTPEDVQRVAKTYLQPQHAVLVWSVPSDEQISASPSPNERQQKVNCRLHSHLLSESGDAVGFKLTDAKRVVLPNGLTLVMLENHRLPIVVAAAQVADVRLREPADKNGILALTGQMLEEGTTNYTGVEIATLIEDTGGSLSVGATGAALKVLTPDTTLGLRLLFECLARPTFPPEQFEQQRAQLLATIADVETQPRNRARAAFNALVYGDHPYGRPAYGRKEIVEKLTADDLKAFHASAFAPNFTTLVVVGDFNTQELVKTVEQLTADWKRVDADKPQPPTPPYGESVVEKILTDPSAAQTHVFIGHLGVKRDNPDYYKLLVMDNVLGTGPGFTDRLSATLRDRQGLAYTVTATITPTATDQPGTFTGYIGTFPDKYIWVRDAFLREINRLRDEPPTEQEVEDAKNYLLGSMPFRLVTAADVASELLTAERYGLGFDFHEKFQAEVSRVTPVDVQAVARMYLQPKRIAVVACGPIDQNGKLLTASDNSNRGRGP